MDKVTIFQDRTEAGHALAAKLEPLLSPPVVVVGIPRGGVEVALPVAERLRAPLTVAYARKLTAPAAPELAFGALDEDGEVILDPRTVALLQLAPDDIERARATVQGEIRRRMALYRIPPLSAHLPGAAVVLVDDGLATGLTMRAALAYARRHAAREVTVAVPCASAEAARRFRREADRFLSLIVDEEFGAVGEYYVDFSPVSDARVQAVLGRAQAVAAPTTEEASGLRIAFQNSPGRQLTGRLLLPAGSGPHPVVTFAHGWGSGKDSPRNRATAEALRARGFAAFLFDFTGHGESEGTLDQSTPAQQADDLRGALNTLEALDEIDPGRMGVVGASSGAAAALLRAAEDRRIRALVLRSGNPTGAEAVASHVTVPTLLIVGELDEPARTTNQELATRLGGPLRIEIVSGGDHLFEAPEALRRASDLTAAWFLEHLRTPAHV